MVDGHEGGVPHAKKKEQTRADKSRQEQTRADKSRQEQKAAKLVKKLLLQPVQYFEKIADPNLFF
jgi:hypothetical protein